MVISELLAMPVGAKITGGVVFTVKTTKKWIKLPDNNYLLTVVLTDLTGEVLADFRSATYSPLKKNDLVSIRDGEIQAADPESRLTALELGKKLFVNQYSVVESRSAYMGDDSDGFGMAPDYAAFHQNEIAGKCRYGIGCSLLRAGMPIKTMLAIATKAEINELVEFFMKG